MGAGGAVRIEGAGSGCPELICGSTPSAIARSRVRRLLGALALVGVLATLLPNPAATQQPTLTLEAEAGPVWQSYNDVQIPNDGAGSRFSIYDVAGAGPWPAARLYVTWRLGERQALRLLFAPLTLEGPGVAAEAVRFAGATYASGRPLDATYTFNSYRLSYRWRVRETERTEAWIGFTAKVRDATIALSQGATSSRKDDLGFVPLLHVAAMRRLGDRLVLDVDADGLAGGPGRAVDASLKLGYQAGRRWSLHAGYRTVEGGADVSEVYTFAWLNYAVVSFRVGF